MATCRQDKESEWKSKEHATIFGDHANKEEPQEFDKKHAAEEGPNMASIGAGADKRATTPPTRSGFPAGHLQRKEECDPAIHTIVPS